MITKFLFMDEKYADQGASPDAQVVSLTGVLVPAPIHPLFRRKFYDLVNDIVGDPEHVIGRMPEIHASELLPDKTDEQRFAFLQTLVSLVVELDFKIYRIGYRKINDYKKVFSNERDAIGMCFFGIISCISSELEKSQIWPVMEYDGSKTQDQMFAGQIQNVDYFTSRIGQDNVSVKNSNLGEVFYSTKKSAHGAIVDCVSYILHMRYLRSIGKKQTAFKEKLSDIAEGLVPVIEYDEVVDIKYERPPAGYVPKGPIRYAFPITPKD